MPNYAPGFGTAGALAGGATGGGIGSVLGSLLAPLDYPRQALWNAVKKPYDAIQSGDWSELLGAIPGTAGAVLGGVMGGPLGIAAGSALGGALQGAGKSTGAEQFNAPEVSDLTGTEDFLPNLLVGAATDPLTFAGGLGGASRGRQAGKAFGKGLEESAVNRSLGYKTTAQDIEKMLTGVKNEGGAAEARSILTSNPQVWPEIMPGSEYLGHGAEATAFKRPDGGVTMVRGGGLARPDIPEMLPAARSRSIPTDLPTRPVRIEHTQMANAPGHNRLDTELTMDVLNRRENMGAEMNAMTDSLQKRGVDFWDEGLRNVGFDRQGNMRIIDSGAVQSGNGGNLARAADQTGQQPGMLRNAILNLLGADKSVQGELSAAVGGAKPGIPEAYYRPNKGVSDSFNIKTPMVEASGAKELLEALKGKRRAGDVRF